MDCPCDFAAYLNDLAGLRQGITEHAKERGQIFSHDGSFFGLGRRF